MNRAQHRRDELRRIRDRLPGFSGEHFGVSNEIAMNTRRQPHVELNGLVVGNGAFSTWSTFSSPIWLEYQIAVDDGPDRKSGPDCECRLDVKIAAHDLLPGLIQ